VTTSDKDWSLRCPHCGKEYHIGIDAGIMTIEETIGMMRGVGTIVSGSLGSTQREDMLYSFGGAPPDRLGVLQQQAREAVKMVRDSLATGQERVWYCKECGLERGTHPFPAPLPQ
jgi:ribosomal protein L37AE/L43A